MTQTSLKVAVIVPIYNTQVEFLKESIQSIFEQKQGKIAFVYKIFLYDDGSHQIETLQYLNELDNLECVIF